MDLLQFLALFFAGRTTIVLRYNVLLELLLFSLWICPIYNLHTGVGTQIFYIYSDVCQNNIACVQLVDIVSSIYMTTGVVCGILRPTKYTYVSSLHDGNCGVIKQYPFLERLNSWSCDCSVVLDIR